MWTFHKYKMRINYKEESKNTFIPTNELSTVNILVISFQSFYLFILFLNLSWNLLCIKFCILLLTLIFPYVTKNYLLLHF